MKSVRIGIGIGIGIALAALAATFYPAAARAPAAYEAPFRVEQVLIAMRDGTKLQTVILRPSGATGKLPILLQRTPYGIDDAATTATAESLRYLRADGYILVYQSMRGRFGSEGNFAMSMALAPKGSRAPDEATDSYDTIDWLVRHVGGNNGRVGMLGVSYPGYAAAVALARPHPALKAVSPQAAWNDWWMHDDLHRYGAMRLSYATDWLHLLQRSKDNATFAYDRADTYDWFLAAGSAAAIDRDHFRGAIPMFSAMIAHPDYDSHWTGQRWTDRLGKATVPTLNVAGFWDQEDPLGSWQIYRKLEANDPDGLNMIVAGPWNHGSWRGTGDRVGKLSIGVDSGTAFRRDIEAPFFAYWLHGKGPKPTGEARVMQGGSWVWKSYASWPPKGAKATSLYLQADGTLSFTAPPFGAGCRDFVSDPANPVPYRERPISSTWGGDGWPWWEAADQRFLAGRPDMLSYTSAPLDADLTVTGTIAATLFASTSGTDSDFVVKLIEVQPDGFQLPIAMEVRRGRWLESFATSKPLVPGKVVAWDVPLRDHDHVFRKGHRLMVQIQSSWFPVIDRNPQRFVPNIYKAQPADYVAATQTVCSTSAQASKITLPVVR
jgi:putative CocE/NonD family hydrolase